MGSTLLHPVPVTEDLSADIPPPQCHLHLIEVNGGKFLLPELSLQSNLEGVGLCHAPESCLLVLQLTALFLRFTYSTTSPVYDSYRCVALIAVLATLATTPLALHITVLEGD
jgi:hypothetical protein